MGLSLRPLKKIGEKIGGSNSFLADVFSANTQADIGRRVAAGQSSDYTQQQQQKGVAGRSIAVNPIQRAVVTARGIGEGIIQSPVQLGNWATSTMQQGTKDYVGAQKAQLGLQDTQAQIIATQGRIIKDPTTSILAKQRAQRLLNLMGQQSNETFGNIKEQQTKQLSNLDTRKNLAAGASTVFDLATLGVGSGAQAGLKTAAKEGVGAFAKVAAKEGAKAAGTGAVSGALSPIVSKGKDATAKEILTGAATGAAVGGILPVAQYGATKVIGGVIKGTEKTHLKATMSPEDYKAWESLVISRANAEGKGNTQLVAAFDEKINRIHDKYTRGEDGFIKNPLANDAPQVGKTEAPIVTPKQKPVVSSIAQGRVESAIPGQASTRAREAFVPEQAKPVVNLNQVDALPSNMRGGTGKVYQREMNIGNYALNESDAQTLAEMAGKDVTTLTNEDVKRAAQFVGVDNTKLTDREMQAVLAGRLNQSREVTANINELGRLKAAGASEEELLAAAKRARESVAIDQSQKSFAGRQLQAERILKTELSPEDKFVRLLVTSGADPNKIDKVLIGLDISTPEAAIKAWRSVVPATAGDWMTKYRYTNMLSSPITHIVNATSNLTGVAGIRPIHQAFTATVDALRAGATGTARKEFFGEIPAYYKGAVGEIHNAVSSAFESMKRFSDYKNVDMVGDMNTPLAIGGVKGTADAALSFIPKLLNAGDVLFSKIAAGGEAGSLAYKAAQGVDVGDIASQATAKAEHTLFRSKLGSKDQGYILQAIDTIPQLLNTARRSNNPIVRNVSSFAFPFVATPTNIFKQGIEYSPFGITTLAGNANKTAQAAKALMGTTAVAMAAGAFAANDAITGAEPQDAAQRDAFRAEGKLPYAVKIGGHWFQYSKLHPAIAFNFATVAAVKQALDNNTIDQSQGDKIMSMVGGVLGFYRDQSYVKGLGDFVSTLQGIDTSSAGNLISSVAGSTVSQALPLQSFNNWLGRLINDTQTKVDYSADFIHQTAQRLFKDYPLGDKATGAPQRMNPYTGEPIPVQNRGINAVSPVKVGTDMGYGNTTGLNVAERQMMQGQQDPQQFRSDLMYQKGIDKLDKRVRDSVTSDAGIKQGASGKFYAKVNNKVETYDTQQEADMAVAKDAFKKSDKKIQTVGDTVFYKIKDGTVKDEPKVRYDSAQEIAKIDLELDRTKRANDVNKWADAAQKKWDALEKKKSLYDPETEADEITKLTNAQEDLQAQADKYAEYGGFTKGKSGGKNGGLGISTASMGVSVTPTGKTGRPSVSAKGGQLRSVAARTTSTKPRVTSKRSKV